MIKKLKDKVWRDCTIKIDRLVEQYQEDIMTTNKTIGFLVNIEFNKGRNTMFRANSVRELWKMIKHFSMINK